jgi:hypothetical protein
MAALLQESNLFLIARDKKYIVARLRQQQSNKRDHRHPRAPLILESQHLDLAAGMQTGTRTVRCPFSVQLTSVIPPGHPGKTTRTGFWLFLFRCQGATAPHTSLRKAVRLQQALNLAYLLRPVDRSVRPMPGRFPGSSGASLYHAATACQDESGLSLGSETGRSRDPFVLEAATRAANSGVKLAAL